MFFRQRPWRRAWFRVSPGPGDLDARAAGLRRGSRGSTDGGGLRNRSRRASGCHSRCRHASGRDAPGRDGPGAVRRRATRTSPVGAGTTPAGSVRASCGAFDPPSGAVPRRGAGRRSRGRIPECSPGPQRRPGRRVRRAICRRGRTCGAADRRRASSGREAGRSGSSAGHLPGSCDRRPRAGHLRAGRTRCAGFPAGPGTRRVRRHQPARNRGTNGGADPGS